MLAHIKTSNIRYKLWLWTAIWVGLCILTFSNVATYLPLFLLLLAIIVGWILLWLVRWILWRRIPREKRIALPKNMWQIEPLVLLVPLILGFSGTFSWVQFNLSETALDLYVMDVRAGKVNIVYEFNHPVRNVGLYAINYTDILPDGSVRILTASQGMFDRAGFVYSDSNPPPRQGEDFYKHIKQKWWYWHESW